MPRKAKSIKCDDKIREKLERMAKSQKEEKRLVRRTEMILGCLDGNRRRKCITNKPDRGRGRTFNARPKLSCGQGRAYKAPPPSPVLC